MSEITFRFFKGDATQEPLKSIVNSWKQSRKERNEKLKPIFAEMPFYDRWYGSETAIYGIVCNANNPALEQAKQEAGYKIERVKEDKYLIKPNKRYKKGKELDQAIRQIREILATSPDFSHYSLEQLNLLITVGDYAIRQVSFSSAGMKGDVYLAQIPYKQKGNWGDEFPTIPDFLTEIKESEFLAIQGK